MRAFIEVRRILIRENDLREQLKQIKEKLGDHDARKREASRTIWSGFLMLSAENYLCERMDRTLICHKRVYPFVGIACAK